MKSLHTLLLSWLLITSTPALCETMHLSTVVKDASQARTTTYGHATYPEEIVKPAPPASGKEIVKPAPPASGKELAHEVVHVQAKAEVMQARAKTMVKQGPPSSKKKRAPQDSSLAALPEESVKQAEHVAENVQLASVTENTMMPEAVALQVPLELTQASNGAALTQDSRGAVSDRSLAGEDSDALLHAAQQVVHKIQKKTGEKGYRVASEAEIEDVSYYKNELQKKLDEIRIEKSRSEQYLRSLRHMKRQQEKIRQLTISEGKRARRLNQLSYNYEIGEYEYLYKQPLPYNQGSPFLSTFFTYAEYQHDSARKAASVSGKKRDLSYKVFGNDTYSLRDMVLESALLADGVIVSNPTQQMPLFDNPLYFLAGDSINLKAQQERDEVKLGFAFHTFEDTITVGFELPLVHNVQRVKIEQQFPAADLANALLNTEVLGAGGTFPDFLRQVMGQRGVKIPECDSLTGFGDIAVYTNLRIFNTVCEQLYVGSRLTFPTGQQGTIANAWRNNLGNGGYPSLSVSVAGVNSIAQFFNPYFSADCTWKMPLPLRQRVPHYVSATNSIPNDLYGVVNGNGKPIDANGNLIGNPGAGSQQEIPTYALDAGSNLPLTDYYAYIIKPFDRLESQIKGFAFGVDKITIQPGLDLNILLGSTFEKFIVRQGFMDLFYRLRAKTSDFLQSGVPLDLGDASVWVKDSKEFSHTLGINFAYQFEDNGRLSLGGEYVLGGQNVARTFSIKASIDFGF